MSDIQTASGTELTHGKLDDLPLDTIGKVIASTPPGDFISLYENARKQAAAARSK